MSSNTVVDPTVPPGLNIVSAFLAMEPTDHVITLARNCGGDGSVTESVQRFIWDHCIVATDGGSNGLYVQNFVKKLILEAESGGCIVLDELYEKYGYYMASSKDESIKVCKCISFLFNSEDYIREMSYPSLSKLVVRLQCSLNMLEGDTGSTVWPSSLYLSEFILSFPDIFANKSCFEVGSGVGLVGICLSHVKASKVTLSDGDQSTLANMKLNLELNLLRNETDINKVKSTYVGCIHLPWESAKSTELQDFTPDIILGADIVYDPTCIPHLVRLLAILLSQTKVHSQHHELIDNGCTKQDGSLSAVSKMSPVAYIASVIRNVKTFNYFVELSRQADLVITDITQTLKPFDMLPYMKSYDRSNIRLFTVASRATIG